MIISARTTLAGAIAGKASPALREECLRHIPCSLWSADSRAGAVHERGAKRGPSMPARNIHLGQGIGNQVLYLLLLSQSWHHAGSWPPFGHVVRQDSL